MTEQFQNLPTNARAILGFLFLLAMGTALATYFYLAGDWLVGLAFFVIYVATSIHGLVYWFRIDPRLREIMAHLTGEERKQLVELNQVDNEFMARVLLSGLLLIVPMGVIQSLDWFITWSYSIQGQLIKLVLLVCGFAAFYYFLLPLLYSRANRIKEFLFQTEFARNKGYLP